MIKIIAVRYEDGFAYVYDGVNLLKVGPPYDIEKFSKIKPEDVSRAVSKEGFSSEDENFSCWIKVIAHLKQKRQKI